MSSAIFLKKVESFLKRIRKWDTEFLCIGKTAGEVFNVPKPEEVLPRIMANLDYFCVNYAAAQRHRRYINRGIVYAHIPHPHSDNCIQLHSVPRSKMVRERYGEKVSSLEC